MSSQKAALRFGYVAAIVCVLAGALTVSNVSMAYGAGGWTPQVSNTTCDLRSVAFIDSHHGWAVGEMGTIRATTNGGISWTSQRSGTTSNLYSVAFTDAAHGLVVGQNGTILSTSDGGVHWTLRRSGGGLDLYSVTMADASRAWAVGQLSTILVTANGGATWSAQRSGFFDGRYFDSVDFADTTHGWAVGNHGTILATADGGANWVAQSSTLTASDVVSGITFSDASHGWAVGRYGDTADGMILATDDGGLTWVAQTGSGVTSGTPLYSVASTDDMHAWAVGWSGVVYATKDGGSTWIAQRWGDGYHNLLAVAAIDTTGGWAVGTSGLVLATLDGGVGVPAAEVNTPESGTIARNRRFGTHVVFRPSAGFRRTTMVLNYYHWTGSRWSLGKTMTVPDYGESEDLSRSGDVNTSLSASGKWKVTLRCIGESSGATFTSDPAYFTVKPSYSSISMSSNRTNVSYDTRHVTFTARLLVNGKPAKHKSVKLYKNGRYYRTLKTNVYGRVKMGVAVGFGTTPWQWRYAGSSTVASSKSRDVRTAGHNLYLFTDNGNLLEYPYLRSGHTYQVRLTAGYRVDLSAPSSRQVYHKYSTFSFGCRVTGTWSVYAANRDIFAGEPVVVSIW